jgi:hypothetical protein
VNRSESPVRTSEMILVVCLLVCLLPLCTYRLEVYPVPWFDEGLGLQAAKNVASTGEYGLRSTEGMVEFHPALQSGPTVVIPIAWVFRLAGTGILQARLVIVFYTVLALVIFYRLVRETSTMRVAFLASLLLIFTFDSEFTSFVAMGRQVLAEVPALAFFWLGTLVWVRTWSGSRRWRLVCTGLLWGLAMVTKVQFALILPVSVMVFWLFDRISVKQLQIDQVLVPVFVSGVCAAMWYGYQMLALSFPVFWQQAAALGAAGGMHLLSFRPRRTLGAIVDLSGSTLLLFGLPGMAYAVKTGWYSRDRKRHQQVFLVLFTLVWSGWYALLSIGWMRYAFVPAAMGVIFAARLLGAVWDWAGQHGERAGGRLRLSPGQLAVGCLIVMLVLSGLVPMARKIAHSPDSGLRDLAEYLNTHIPTDEVIESWEWEVDFLTDHTYHHPPYDVTNSFTELIWYGTPLPPGVYDPLTFRPEYLIRGPFARWTGIYSKDFLSQDWVLIESFGEYDLYEVIAEGQE